MKTMLDYIDRSPLWPINIILVGITAAVVLVGCSQVTPKENKEKFLTFWNNYSTALSSLDSSYRWNQPNLSSKVSSLKDADRTLHNFINELIKSGEVQKLKRPDLKTTKGDFNTSIKFNYDITIWTIIDKGA